MKKLIGIAIFFSAIIGASCADTQKQLDGWQGRKVLVAYYSATGTTKAVAEKIAGLLGADLFAIEPSDPYSSGDRNSSRRYILPKRKNGCGMNICKHSF